jgi:hypothetical protein
MRKHHTYHYQFNAPGSHLFNNFFSGGKMKNKNIQFQNPIEKPLIFLDWYRHFKYM